MSLIMMPSPYYLSPLSPVSVFSSYLTDYSLDVSDDDIVLTSPSNVFSTVDTNGDIVSYIHPPSKPGYLSPPIKVTTHSSDEDDMPFGLNIKTQPIFIKDTFGRIVGTKMLISDIYVPSLNVGASLLRQPITEDVCDTPIMREKITKYYYKKTLDKWLFRKEKSKFLNKYLKVVDGKVKLITDIQHPDDYVNNNQETVDKKVNYIEEKFFTLADMYTILQHFVKGTHVSWCDLPKQSYFIKESIEKSLENKFVRLITGKDAVVNENKHDDEKREK